MEGGRLSLRTTLCFGSIRVEVRKDVCACVHAKAGSFIAARILITLTSATMGDFWTHVTGKIK